MNNEVLIISMLEKMNARINEISEQMNGRMDEMSEKMSSIDNRLRNMEITVENKVLDGIQLLSEGHDGIIETMAKKEDVDALREDLGLQKFRIDVITDKLRQG